LSLLLELLATALGNAQLRRAGNGSGQDRGFAVKGASSEDAELGVRLTVQAVDGFATVLHAADGDLTLEGLDLSVVGVTDHASVRTRTSAS
jgi:hypothetical protein